MLRSILATALLGIVFFLAEKTELGRFIHQWIWYILAFFLGVSVLIHRLMEIGFRNKRENFVPFYISTIVVRLLLCMIFVAFFLYRGVPDQKIFIINFLVLYLFYTGFEIYGLYSNLRRDL